MDYLSRCDFYALFFSNFTDYCSVIFLVCKHTLGTNEVWSVDVE